MKNDLLQLTKIYHDNKQRYIFKKLNVQTTFPNYPLPLRFSDRIYNICVVIKNLKNKQNKNHKSKKQW